VDLKELTYPILRGRFTRLHNIQRAQAPKGESVKHRVWKAVTGLVEGALVVSAVAAAVLIVSGCSTRKYGHVLRNNPECVGEANIKMAKVDFCLNTTDGNRANVDSCLVGQGVPSYKVDRLNVCLGVERSSSNY